MPEKRFDHILISRPDAIGDVVLTLPIAGMLKQRFPDSRISFLGRDYTRAVVQCCAHVDAFISLDEVRGDLVQALHALQADAVVHAFPEAAVVQASKAAGIPVRIGTGKRWHTFTQLTHRHWFSRKKSDLHEAQLNAKLLTSLGFSGLPSQEEFPAFYGFTQVPEAPAWSLDLLSREKPNLIFHPKSKGSAIDWPLERWAELIASIGPEQATLFISGTEAEGAMFREVLPLDAAHVHDISGKLSLDAFIGFIAKSDGLVACSTGPLHIAAALGRFALGLYTNVRPMHARRWAPLGMNAHVLEAAHEGSALPFTAEQVRARLPL